MTVTIRPASQADGDLLEEIERESFADGPWRGEDFLRYDCIVAQVNGVIAGFLVARTLIAGEREILNIAVCNRMRRCGIASQLLKHELAKGVTHFLEVRESNGGAQSLYRAHGFTQLGRRPDYYRSPVEAAIVMQLKK